jgi:hypothetical protein
MYSRARYDDGAYAHRLNESVGPGEYMLHRPYSCDESGSYAPGIIFDKKGARVCETMIDVDSELMGLTRKYSQCPSKKYVPFQSCAAKPATYATTENRFLVPEPTLISNPKCTNKETTANRWEWLCQNPQDNAIPRFEMLINNSLVVKDNHRPLIERPLDQEAALPPAANDCVRLDWISEHLDNAQNVPMYHSGQALTPCPETPP